MYSDACARTDDAHTPNMDEQRSRARGYGGSVYRSDPMGCTEATQDRSFLDDSDDDGHCVPSRAVDVSGYARELPSEFEDSDAEYQLASDYESSDASDGWISDDSVFFEEERFRAVSVGRNDRALCSDSETSFSADTESKHDLSSRERSPTNISKWSQSGSRSKRHNEDKPAFGDRASSATSRQQLYDKPMSSDVESNEVQGLRHNDNTADVDVDDVDTSSNDRVCRNDEFPTVDDGADEDPLPGKQSSCTTHSLSLVAVAPFDPTLRLPPSKKARSYVIPLSRR